MARSRAPLQLAQVIPAVLAFSLLAFQAILPWTARYYVSMDGPSHLYNSWFVFHPSPFYQLRPALSTNWGTVALFNLASRVSVTHAEAMVASLTVVLSFLSFFYLFRSLDTKAVWSPILSFLTFTWFLFAGYYNYSFGVVLLALAVGYYLRRASEPKLRSGLVLSTILLCTFFTHVFAAALAALIIGIAAIWNRRFILATAVLPTCVLMAMFVRGSAEGMSVLTAPSTQFITRVFSLYIHLRWNEATLVIVMLLYMGAGIALLKREDWVSPRGAIACAALFCLALTFLLPERGFGGDQLKERTTWIVFLLGSTVAASSSRLRWASAPLAILITALTGIGLANAAVNARHVSAEVEKYETAVRSIPRLSRVVRVRAGEHNTLDLAYDPLYHADSWLAVEHEWFALSDYQALSRLFALELHPRITEQQRKDLWALENGDESSIRSLNSLLADKLVDYALVLGDRDLANDSRLELIERTQWLRVLRVRR